MLQARDFALDDVFRPARADNYGFLSRTGSEQ
jgi:hypothetical protein